MPQISRRTFVHTFISGLCALSFRNALTSAHAQELTLAPSTEGQIIANLLNGDRKPPLAIWGENIPGPLLHAKRAEPYSLKLTNHLPFPTTLHFRGLRPDSKAPPATLMPPLVQPDEAFTFKFTPPDPGLYIYEADARFGGPAESVRPLNGLLLVSDPASDQAKKDEKDIFLTLHDIGDNRVSIHTPPPYVNGHLFPETLTLQGGTRFRLRIANLSRTQLYTINFEDLSPVIIAIDGQPCPLFEPVRQTIPVGPGARFDVLCTLLNNPDKKTAAINLLSDIPRPIMIFNITPGFTLYLPPPTPLPPNPTLPAEIPLQDAFKTDLTLDMDETKATINQQAGRTEGKALFQVTAGQAVSLGLINKTNRLISLHFHGHVVRQLHNLDDGWEPYWRDSLLIPPGKTVRCAFIAPYVGDWVIEATDAALTQKGLWGFFKVVEKKK